MHIIEIPEAKLKWYMPSDLSECNSSQYIEMCQLILLFQTGNIPYEHFRVCAIYKLLNLHKSTSEIFDDRYSNLYLLSEKIDSFFEDLDGKKIIKQYYITNPVPKFGIWKNYYGPSDQFQNITFGEYTDALRLHMDYSVSGDFRNLELIAAIFYRPKKKFHFLKKIHHNYDGDIREPYNSSIIEKRADAFKKFPVGFIFGVHLLFASFQKFISTAIIPWGGSEIDLSILFTDDSSEKSENFESDIPGIGMDSVIFSLAESGVFGTKKQTMNTNIWEILIRMYDVRKRDLDLEKQTKKNDTNTSS
jgi:hypothetical protein